MKPAPFAYFAPDSLDEALQYLADFGYDAKVLAGGQSLIPAMNFRLARPSILVDLNRVAALSGLRQSSRGGLHIGAMTRQRAVERSALVAACAPLLHAAMPSIAHVQIRNRGTIGGSLAHADPAAELPAIAVALDAVLTVRSTQGSRVVRAADFYLGLFTTDLAPDEVVVEIELPPTPRRTGWGFAEFARRKGDYAMAGCAALVTRDEGGVCRDVRLVYFSVGDTPVTAASIAALIGEMPSADTIAEVAHAAAIEDIDPTGDIHSTVAYRRHLAEVLAIRALTDACDRALAPAPQPA